MTYLDAVLKESLRLFPSAPCILRKTSEEIELKGYKLPKGSELLLSLFAMHHDASVYPEPHAFKPERWLEKEVPLDEKPFCYVPFSGYFIFTFFSIQPFLLSVNTRVDISYQW